MQTLILDVNDISSLPVLCTGELIIKQDNTKKNKQHLGIGIHCGCLCGGSTLGYGVTLLGNENENTGCDCYIICFTVSLKHKVYFKKNTEGDTS